MRPSVTSVGGLPVGSMGMPTRPTDAQGTTDIAGARGRADGYRAQGQAAGTGQVSLSPGETASVTVRLADPDQLIEQRDHAIRDARHRLNVVPPMSAWPRRCRGGTARRPGRAGGSFQVDVEPGAADAMRLERVDQSAPCPPSSCGRGSAAGGWLHCVARRATSTSPRVSRRSARAARVVGARQQRVEVGRAADPRHVRLGRGRAALAITSIPNRG